ncbi:MAG TPA: hypothetical protein PK002_06210 [Cellvibrio sp.]|nr:hypothetical protein [Cellvibrio sp.]
MNVYKITVIALSLTLIACSPKNADEKPQGVLSDAQKQTLDKSKKTEELLDKANKERMKEVDEESTEK